jgi:GNAT superfamily N-acetyltransferase
MPSASPERIRAARPKDLAACTRLVGELFALERDFAFDPRRVRRGLALLLRPGRRHRVLVAAAGRVVRGMVSVQLVISTAEGGPAAWLEDLVVAKAHRGRGLGSRLLAAAEAWACRRGVTRLQLVAEEANQPALQFYHRHGWETTHLVVRRRRP